MRIFKHHGQQHCDQKHSSYRGFTLVELLVATGIITIVMLVAIGAVITIQDANRKAQAVRAIIDNLHGAVENMSRKIRTGGNYRCVIDYTTETYEVFNASDCIGEDFGTTFAFVSSEDADTGEEGSPTVYSMQCVAADGITRRPPNQSTGLCATTERGTLMYYKKDLFDDFQPLVDPKINVTGLRFYVRNTAGAGYPSVLMTLKGTIKIEKVNIETPFNIQTTISQYLKS